MPFGLIYALIATAICVLNSRAHQTTDSYLSLSLESNHLRGRWAIALRDLDHVLTIDTDKDGEVSDTELKKARPGIEKFALDAIRFQSANQNLAPKLTGFEIEEHSDAVYATLLFELAAGGPDITIAYDLFFHTDPLHRGLFRLDLPNRTETTIFSPAEPVHQFSLEGAKTYRLPEFIREGVRHIWQGIDHILFLVALLLPAVLRRESGRWAVGSDWREALTNIVKVVTAFTVAHSITLSLAALGLVRVSPRVVEPVIAASVFLAAINNIRVFFPERTWVIAFSFGLIHGFGFASGLADLGLQKGSLGLALFGFNVGVELGQLAIVALFVPLALSIRSTRFYRQVLLPVASSGIAVLALIWMGERILDRKLLPF